VSRRRFLRNAGILSFSLLVVLVALLMVDLVLIALVHFLQHQVRDDLSTAPADQATVSAAAIAPASSPAGG